MYNLLCQFHFSCLGNKYYFDKDDFLYLLFCDFHTTMVPQVIQKEEPYFSTQTVNSWFFKVICQHIHDCVRMK